MSATPNEHGQITLPEDLRDRLGLKPGSLLDFHVNNDSELVLSPIDEAELKARRERLLNALATIEVDNPWHGTTDEYMAVIRGED